MTTIQTAVLNKKRQPVLTTIEVSITKGIGIHVIGLPDNAMKETLLRVVTALQSCGYYLPGKKICIYIKPWVEIGCAPELDLAIALGIIVESGQERINLLFPFSVAGELGLNGEIRPVFGARIIAEEMCRHALYRSIILPEVSAIEALPLVLSGTELLAVNTLADVVNLITHDDMRHEYNVANCKLLQEIDYHLENNHYLCV